MPTSSAVAAQGEECPFPTRKVTDYENRVPDSKRYYDECQKLVGEYRQLEKEWEFAFSSARSDFQKSRREKDHEAGWAALKRIFLNMNLREPDLNKLIKRANELSSVTAERAKLKPLPVLDAEGLNPQDPIVKAVQDATDKIEKIRKEESDSLQRLADFFSALGEEMKEKKGEWLEQISRPGKT